jgi:hypothetical protein
LYEQRRAELPLATTSRDFRAAVTSARRPGETYRLAVQLLQEHGRLGPSLVGDEGSAGGQGAESEDSGSESEWSDGGSGPGGDGGGSGSG